MNLTLLADNDLITGHGLLSDWLLLIGAIVFFVAAIIAVVPMQHTTTEPARTYPAWLGHGFLIAIGLTLIAVAWLVL
jgi:hypothetical protein